MQNSENWTRDEFCELVRAAAERAARDRGFRLRLLHDPQAALEQIGSKSLPPGLRIRTLEREGYDTTIVLPDPTGEAGELPDSALEQVAGGGWPYPPVQWP